MKYAIGFSDKVYTSLREVKADLEDLLQEVVEKDLQSAMVHELRSGRAVKEVVVSVSLRDH